MQSKETGHGGIFFFFFPHKFALLIMPLPLQASRGPGLRFLAICWLMMHHGASHFTRTTGGRTSHYLLISPSAGALVMSPARRERRQHGDALAHVCAHINQGRGMKIKNKWWWCVRTHFFHLQHKEHFWKYFTFDLDPPLIGGIKFCLSFPFVTYVLR